MKKVRTVVFCSAPLLLICNVLLAGDFDKYESCPVDDSRVSIFSQDQKSSDNLSYQIRADKISYLGGSKQIELLGNSHLESGNIDIYANKILYNVDDKTIGADDSYIQTFGIRFWVKSFSLKKNKDIEYNYVTVTYCDGPLENLDWQIDTDQVRHDYADHSINLYHATLKFKKIPIFYFPWINIPLSRRSGLLVPTLGQETLQLYDWEGYFYRQPIFMNLSNGLDATVSLGWIQDRGILLSNEIRHLNSKGKMNVHFDWKESDRILEQVPESQEEYRRLLIDARYKLFPHWTLSTKWLDISPRLLYEIIPVSLLDQTHSASFNQEISLKGDYDSHQYSMQNFKNTSLESEKKDGYVTLPRLAYQYTNSYENQDYSVAINTSRLLSPEERNLKNYQVTQVKPTWRRIDYTNFYQTYMEVAMYANRYDIDKFQDTDTIGEAGKTISYSSYYTKLGGQLHLNNTQTWFPKNTYARLSPLLYYLYSPHREDGGIPFATYSSLRIDSFRSLLQINRYNRDDFIGESNRIVGGVEQFFFGSQWRTRLTIGKNHNLVDPTTTSLPDFDTAFNYWFGEVKINYDLLGFNLNTQWDDMGANLKRLFSQVYIEDSQKNVFRINYGKYVDQPNVGNLAETIPEYLGFGMSKKIDSWRIAQQINYRISDDYLGKNMFGFIYDSCCWKIGGLIIGKPQIFNPKQIDYTINVTFVFKGLLSVGRTTDLEETIYERVSASED